MIVAVFRYLARPVAAAFIFFTFFLSDGFAQSTIYWSKDHIRDGAGREIATARPPASETLAPSTPGSFGTTAVTSNSVSFSWSPSSDEVGGSGLAGYKLYRGSLPVAVVGPSTTSYTDNTVQSQSGYSYTVRAFDLAGNHSAASNTASFTTNVAGTGIYDGSNSLVTYSGSGWANDQNYYPLAYNGTQHYSRTTGDQVSFTFSGTSVSVVFTHFMHMGIANVAIDGTSVGTIDMYNAAGQWQSSQPYSGLASGTHTITVTVSGSKNASSSDYYMIIDAFAVGTPLPPSAASGLAATAVPATQINLSWTDNSANESGFKIERKIGADGTYTQIDTVGANTTTYASTGLDNGTVYYYRVRPYNGAGNGDYSPSASACNCTVAVAGAYDGENGSILFSSGWYDDPNTYSTAYNSTLFFSNTANSKATFSFRGSSVTWLHLKYEHMGIANVVIDGNNMGNVDLYSASNLWQQPSTWNDLSFGDHTMTITITGQKNASSTEYYVDVDGFIVE